VDDLATCCLAALSEEAPAGIYNVGDGDHRTATQFAREVARQAGLGEPRTISWAEAQKVFSPMRLAFLSASRNARCAGCHPAHAGTGNPRQPVRK
jgi:nucleoside-diphosphate-sugar epimerase